MRQIHDLNKNNYQVPDDEKHLYHYVLEKVKFDENTGERLSKPHVQKSGYKTFKQLVPQWRDQGYKITVLHEAEITPATAGAAQKKAPQASAKQVSALETQNKELQEQNKMLREQMKEQNERLERLENMKQTPPSPVIDTNIDPPAKASPKK